MLQTAVVGVGFIGAEHIEAIRRTNLATVAAIVGRSPEQTEQKAKALGIPAFYTDYDAVLQDPSIQVIHICTPNHLHYAMARKALFAGKHVVCEKPMTMTRAEAEELLALARERGLVHAIHFNIRYYPLIRQAKEMIARGQIGRIYSVTGSYLQDWLIKDTGLQLAPGVCTKRRHPGSGRHRNPLDGSYRVCHQRPYYGGQRRLGNISSRAEEAKKKRRNLVRKDSEK